MNCSCCSPENINDLNNTFNADRAKKDAQQFRQKGLDKRGQKLIAPLQYSSQRPLTVLDIGCGAGGVHHELLRRGVAQTVVGVDASSAYLQAAQTNADILGLSQYITYQQADFAQTTADFEEVDLVIMDRVLCCYPHLQQLLGRAASQTKRHLALSFPLESWWLRLPFRLADLVLTLVGSGYHPYLHPHADIVAIAAEEGLRPTHQDRHFIWQIMHFERA